MKSKIILAFAVILAAVGMTSCSTVSRLQNMDNSMVILDSANFEYVKTITETADATYIFGLSGGNPEQEAIEKLKASANLKPNQTLTNIYITSSFRTIWGVVNIKTITATADIIQFK